MRNGIVLAITFSTDHLQHAPVRAIAQEPSDLAGDRRPDNLGQLALARTLEPGQRRECLGEEMRDAAADPRDSERREPAMQLGPAYARNPARELAGRRVAEPAAREILRAELKHVREPLDEPARDQSLGRDRAESADVESATRAEDSRS